MSNFSSTTWYNTYSDKLFGTYSRLFEMPERKILLIKFILEYKFAFREKVHDTNFIKIRKVSF